MDTDTVQKIMEESKNHMLNIWEYREGQNFGFCGNLNDILVAVATAANSLDHNDGKKFVKDIGCATIRHTSQDTIVY